MHAIGLRVAIPRFTHREGRVRASQGNARRTRGQCRWQPFRAHWIALITWRILQSGDAPGQRQRSWRRQGSAPDTEWIAGAQGLVIQRGQAHIVVMMVERARIGSFVDQLEEGRLRDEEMLWSNPVLPCLRETTCHAPAEVKSRSEEGPEAFIINTRFLCRVEGYRLLTHLRYWEGDPRAAEFHAVALSVARSLRLTGSSLDSH